MRGYPLVDPCSLGESSDDPGSGVAVQPSRPIPVLKYWPFVSLTDASVNRPCCTRCQWDGDDLAALAGDDQSPVSSLHPEMFNVGVLLYRVINHVDPTGYLVWDHYLPHCFLLRPLQRGFRQILAFT
jgi:hypothetical protein